MDIQEAIMTRRSIRRYRPEPLTDKDILSILDAAMAAPSGVNLQPWYFVVVRSPEGRRELSEILGPMSQRMLPMLTERFPNHPEVVEETRRFVDDLGGAPVCVLVFQYRMDYNKKESTIIQSVAAAIENMLLAAHGKGIGSCWLTAAQETGMDPVLKERYAPDKGNLVALVTLGYPDQQPREPLRKEGRFVLL